MPENELPPRPQRRQRYRGTHPRRFEERYKEIDAARYPEMAAHLRDQGRTPAGQHVPIMVEEILAELDLKPGFRGIDATLGFGGHAEAILGRLAPEARLLALDADPIEFPKTAARLEALGFVAPAFLARRTNFAGIEAALAEVGWGDGVDFLLADLGVSSMQLDDPRRGFTFKVDGPLDMRMNPKRGFSAADWIARTTPRELQRALRENADEPHAELLARALFALRTTLSTTAALAAAVRSALAPGTTPAEVDLSVRRVFQAVRIEVNDEFGALDALLRALPRILRPEARVAILSFHSGEDRRVKKAFQDGERRGIYVDASRVLRASEEERRRNPRSASAKLRTARRA